MLTRLFKFVLLVSAVLTLNFKHHKVYAQSSCTTLDDQKGACVPMLTCKTIKPILDTAPTPLPPSVSDLAKRSHCGTFNKVHYVCCDANSVDNKPVTEQETPSPQPQPTNTEDSISGSIDKIRPSSNVSDSQIQYGMSVLNKFKTVCGITYVNLISNGENANLSEYPWMALLVYFDGVERTLDCGGSLITDRYVLTAAHCIRVRSKKLVSVRLGEHNTTEAIDCIRNEKIKECSPALQEIDIEEAIYHKGFNGLSNDVGLILLISPATLQTSVRPVCLPITEESTNAVVDRMIIAGWGKVENGVRASILQKALIPVRDNDYCEKAFKYLKLNEYHLCAGGGDKKIDTCFGDSGGPIFYPVPFHKSIRHVQFGVVSVGSIECGEKLPSIFSRVQKYLSWIAGNLKS